MREMLANTRVAWFNGTIMPEGQVLIPYRDKSWKSGDGAFARDDRGERGCGGAQ
jgi:branched-chain amino acid aminotransferase